MDVDAPVMKKPVKFGKAEKRVDLFSAPERTGYDELLRTGQCLDWLYPDDLDRAVHRDEQVEQLSKWLNAKERRPVLLLGEPRSGKTTLVHEMIYRRVKARKRGVAARKKQVWHLSPQRLISGMSYVGGWEDRLLKILAELKKNDHTLYIDDMLGYFLAGRTAAESFSAAQLLKPFVERGDIRLVAEITPGAFRILQEKDRALADLFTVIRVEESGGRELNGMLLTVIRGLERETDCRFESDVLKAVVELQKRYVHDAVFPGKAAEFLRRLANKHADSDIRALEVMLEFHQSSGLAMPFVDASFRWDRKDILAGLGESLVGQTSALERVADTVLTYQARLNDPDRPISTFLFLGPTGVGKTECAKAVSRVLYGSEERMIRFDMNEYVNPWSVTRLIGDFQNPDGLLTGAVRRQPFSVLLLDEIEKAHADVFDLLLQVLGEARLTDSLGRTIDFSNSFIIMTSNLGARGSRTTPGYGESEEDTRRSYVQAARDFFAPEFFNRLDGILPFEPLARDQLRDIAHLLLEGLLKRQGIQRRHGIIDVRPETLDRLVDEGVNPVWGGRGLKRVIEQQVGWPLSRYLASVERLRPSLIKVGAGPGRV
ncbi:MAG: AAA family ATPase, partial [Verrucomicrobiota bacterium]